MRIGEGTGRMRIGDRNNGEKILSIMKCGVIIAHSTARCSAAQKKNSAVLYLKGRVKAARLDSKIPFKLRTTARQDTSERRSGGRGENKRGG